MKKTTTLSLLSLFLLGSTSLFAQDPTEFERVFYFDLEPVEEGDFVYTARNVVALKEYAKFALTLENNSTDYLLFKPSESSFKYDSGDRKVSLKPILIKPHSKKSKTMKVEGGDQFRQKSFSFEVDGVYRIPVDGTVAEAPEFKLPPNKNNFEQDNFKVVMRKFDASTREAKATFEVTYTGENFGVVSPANLSVRANHKKTGEELVYANDDAKTKPSVLQKGEKAKFDAVFHIDGRIVDMQFATMYLQWNDTFVESEAEKQDSVLLDFEMNEPLTREKK